MRIGQNPTKFSKEVARPEKVTVAVLNYIPILSGFYAETLDVLKVCLNSLYENTATPTISWCLIMVPAGKCNNTCWMNTWPDASNS